MVSLTMLWLPILVSAVFLFIAANILWMALPFWHGKDYSKLPDEKTVLDALSAAKSGQYIVPRVDWKKLTPEERTAMQNGPTAYMLVRNPGKFALGKGLVLYFLYMLVITAFVGCLAGHVLPIGADYRHVFHVAGPIGFLAFAFRGVSDSIWYGKPWLVSIKEMIDGLIYAGLIAGTFGWLWPR